MEVVAFLEAERELDKEADAGLDVGQVNELAGGVHVTKGDADKASSHAAAAHLDSAGIGAGGAGIGFVLEGDFGAFGGGDEVLKNEGVNIGTAAHDRAAAELGFAVFTVVAIGVVGGVADVHGDGDVGVDGVGRGGGTAHADLLLSGADGDDAGRQAALPRGRFGGRFFGGRFGEGGEADEGLADDVGADFVVEGAGGADGVVDELELVVVGGGVADGHAGESVFFGAGADIDPHLVGLGNFLAVLGAHEVDGAFSGDTFDGSGGGAEDDAAAGDHAFVVAADGVEVEEAIFVDVGDEQAELVEVAGEHEHRIAGGVERGEAVAGGVLFVEIGGGAHVGVEDGLGLELGAGGRAGVEEIGEERGRREGFGHGVKVARGGGRAKKKRC